MSPVSLKSPPLPVGTVVAARFTLRQPAGLGGMGFVYQALDALSGQLVALKLMHASSSFEASSRFLREAEVLAQLRHPGIVSYIAHGYSGDDQPFLAMEWLEGEDLARRLAREPLSLSDTLQLLRRAADVLAVAHAQGIVHRDLKPSNLFLRGGKAQDAVLLDFGLAHVAAASQPLTQSAVVVGTPGYMAPEQASSQREITPCADIFSLGCVLYECLTGQPPFRAPHLAAVLAKILYTDPPPLRAARPELPAGLQGLLDHMLAKEPDQRIANGQQLLRALARLEQFAELAPPTRASSVAADLSNTEQHLVSMLLATPSTPSAKGHSPTLTADEAADGRSLLESLRQELKTHGAKALVLADGSLLATFLLERGLATDQAALAAHCALAIKERWPESFVVLTTGLSLRSQPLPSGEVMDRAGEILRRLELAGLDTAAQVMLDETTGGLLDPRFQLGKARSGTFLLRGEQLSRDESRPLLGRPTPCVGRAQELTLLEMTFNGCVEDSVARALMVVASAGTGKSRLRHEFLRRMERRAQPPLVLLGRGDPMIAGSAYGLLGHGVRRLCGVVDGEPLEARREKLARRASLHLPPEQVKDTVEFLGELCGVPFPAEDSPKLRAARGDPQAMSLQVTQAMVSLLRAELSHGSVLLVLEDLHWSDVPTVKLVEEVLRELGNSPLMVLALARPEVKEVFPNLWGRRLQEVPLRGLSLKASAQLVQEVLGPTTPVEVMARLAEQAAGNALFLEELIRGVAERRGEETPSTVLAMLQSRLQRLEPGVRRVLLGGSVFGRVFWRGGVQALLGEDFTTEELERCLRQVVELEVVERQAGSRFPGQSEYRFRHALVRDAAYSLVPDALRPQVHLRAGVWLEKAGEQELLVLAEHYQRGQDKQKAVYFFTRAGERLFERQDVQGAQRCVEAALGCEPTGASLTALRSLEVGIAFWRQDFARSFEVGSEVRTQLAPGSAAWGRVMGRLMFVGAQTGRLQDVAMLGPLFLSTQPDPDAITIYIEACSFIAGMLTWSGQRSQSAAVLERMSAVSSSVDQLDGIARGWLYCSRANFDHFLDARPSRSRMWGEQGTAAFLEVNSERNQAATRTVLGLALAALGDVPAAVEVMHQALVGVLRSEQAYAITFTQMHLALVLAGSTEPAYQQEARQVALEVLEKEKGNLLTLGIAHLALAKAAVFHGQLSEAESLVRKACEELSLFLPYLLMARTTLSGLLLAQQRTAEARVEAERGVQELVRMGCAGATSVGMWLTLSEVYFAQGEEAPGEEALRQALRCLRLRAADIAEPRAHERFLRQVPENARARELARQRWGEDWERHEPR